MSSEKGSLKLLVVTGASGGHIFPALALIDRLKESYANNSSDIILVLPRKNIKNSHPDFGCKAEYLSISPIKFSLAPKNLIAILKFFPSVIKSFYILLSFKPDIVLAFGSIVSVPMVILASMAGIKTMIHEQNVIPGRANRFLAKFSDKIAVSFTETKVYFKNYENRVILTGNPLRKELVPIEKKKAQDFFGFKQDKLTILVMGGSQGSARINSAFLKALSANPAKEALQVIHLAGEKDYDLLRKGYADLNIDVKLYSFFERMHYAYCAADLAVCRAGATTITELMFFGLAAIIIPYPYAYRHQIANARVLEKIGAAVLLEDSRLENKALTALLDEFIKNPQKIKNMRQSYHAADKIDAADLMAKEVFSFK